MSVDNLEAADKEKYEKLAVFLDDDPIPIKTLEILWNVDKYEVEDTMNTFLKKCLAICEADTIKDSLVYTLHDLQLDYLKNRLRDDPDRERILHRDFVEAYLRRVNNKYENIKCDGYIFSHLGYHLTMAGLTPLFPDIYLNLGYVEANLKATGPVDILSDYKKYSQYIMGEDMQYEEALCDFEEFCRTVGAQVLTNQNTLEKLSTNQNTVQYLLTNQNTVQYLLTNQNNSAGLVNQSELFSRCMETRMRILCSWV